MLLTTVFHSTSRSPGSPHPAANSPLRARSDPGQYSFQCRSSVRYKSSCRYNTLGWALLMAPTQSAVGGGDHTPNSSNLCEFKNSISIHDHADTLCAEEGCGQNCIYRFAVCKTLVKDLEGEHDHHTSNNGVRRSNSRDNVASHSYTRMSSYKNKTCG